MVQHGQFELDGKPFQIISGEMHYARIPRAYWRARLRMARAMGLNTISTYVFWNVHEPEPGRYDFTGENDVAEFLREAQQEGLHVILRPGPYVCAEWEWGGFPAWLLKNHDIVVRSADPAYMAAVTAWMHRLGRELAPLQAGNGGPIIAVQVENEYGSFDEDHAYMEQMHRLLLESGFTRSLLYTADGPAQVPKGSLPDLPVAINFGTGDAKAAFEQLKKLRPDGPFMSGEYWDGWFDHWGERHHTISVKQTADELEWMLKQGYSVNLYMFHGGTSFGWMNGANDSRGAGYQPDVTSYDYDVPLSESGQPTAKYAGLRKVITEVTGVTPPPVPAAPSSQVIAPFALPQSASLWAELPSAREADRPLAMEDVGQSYGYILYRTTVPLDTHGRLELQGLHDYERIFVNGNDIGALDRRHPEPLSITAHKGDRLRFSSRIPDA